MDLEGVADDIIPILEFILQNIVNVRDVAVIATNAENAIIYYQAVGILELLLDAEIDTFYDQLLRSAMMCSNLLRLDQGGQEVPPTIVQSSNWRGLCGAIVASEWVLAAEIARSSPSTHTEGSEYLEDFLLARFFHGLVLNEPRPELSHILNGIEEALGDIHDPRLELGRSLLSGNLTDSLRAFEDLISYQTQYLAEQSEASIGSDPLFVPLSAIYIEGLAWLRLLERNGIFIDEDYAMCPKLARVPRSQPFSGPGVPHLLIKTP